MFLHVVILHNYKTKWILFEVFYEKRSKVSCITKTENTIDISQRVLMQRVVVNIPFIME